MHMFMAALTTTKESRVGGNFSVGIEHPGGWISLKIWYTTQTYIQVWYQKLILTFTLDRMLRNMMYNDKITYIFFICVWCHMQGKAKTSVSHTFMYVGLKSPPTPQHVALPNFTYASYKPIENLPWVPNIRNNTCKYSNLYRLPAWSIQHWKGGIPHYK